MDAESKEQQDRQQNKGEDEDQHDVLLASWSFFIFIDIINLRIKINDIKIIRHRKEVVKILDVKVYYLLTQEDYVSLILAQWAVERPDLDVSPMGIIGRISRLSLVLDKELERMFAQLDLAHWSFDMLATLRPAGAPYQLSPSELFRSMMVTSGTMTNRIDRLAEKGLVRRIPDPQDRRGVLVELTQQGRELIDSVLISHVANEARLLQPLSREEQQTLAVRGISRTTFKPTRRCGPG